MNLPNRKINIQKLEIVRAAYGFGRTFIAVTDIARNKCVDDKFVITASNDLAGDPYPNTQKKLIIQYRLGNIDGCAIILEGETLSISKKSFNVSAPYPVA